MTTDDTDSPLYYPQSRKPELIRELYQTQTMQLVDRVERATGPMPLVFLLICFELSARQCAVAKEYWEGLGRVALGAGFGGAGVTAMG